MTGASGVTVGIRLLAALQAIDEIETHLVMSPAAHLNVSAETVLPIQEIEGMADVLWRPSDISAPIASGSFETIGMMIVPCSIKTLSAVANCYASDLISRAADVTLKEGRPLLLGLRETPLHRGHIRLMSLVADAGAVIYPLTPQFYARAETIEEMANQMAGRMLSRIGIKNTLYSEWSGLNCSNKNTRSDESDDCDRSNL